MQALPLSVLDLATVSEGGTSAQALDETTELARAADRLGYERFWVAEHHNIDTVASTSPAVLMAHLAAHTERIKLGSGGVMLPNHSPAVVAEQFAMLEALHPGRVDLGVGRAPGSDRITAAAVRGPTEDGAVPDPWQVDDFPSHLIDLMAYLGDVRTTEGPWIDFRATPKATSAPPVLLLGSSGYSAQLAGYLGLPFAFAHHFDGGGVLGALDLYRQRFQPSPVLDEPFVIVSVGLVTAADAATAQYHAAPSLLRRLGHPDGPVLAVAAARRGDVASGVGACSHYADQCHCRGSPRRCGESGRACCRHRSGRVDDSHVDVRAPRANHQP